MIHARAGQPASADDLIDRQKLESNYLELTPDLAIAEQKVAFGTSGHRGSALNTSFNEWHILAITQAIVDYRKTQDIQGPIYVGKDTHALSGPAEQSVLEVLAGNNVECFVASGDYTPTPAVSVAIIDHNMQLPRGSSAQSDGIIITPSHNPPQDGGIKYNPPHGGPSERAHWRKAKGGQTIKSKCEEL
mgnify:CR=1 FL=1